MKHLHLQDAWADFDPRLHVDLVLVNSEQATEHARKPRPATAPAFPRVTPTPEVIERLRFAAYAEPVSGSDY